jgi:hypothetical protein
LNIRGVQIATQCCVLFSARDRNLDDREIISGSHITAAFNIEHRKENK